MPGRRKIKLATHEHRSTRIRRQLTAKHDRGQFHPVGQTDCASFERLAFHVGNVVAPLKPALFIVHPRVIPIYGRHHKPR